MKRNKMPYNNREISWLSFNDRVLDEAFEDNNPLMEKLKFLSITASNLDEFFMVRIAGLMDQIASNYDSKDSYRLTPQQTMEKLIPLIHKFSDKQYNCYNNTILPSLKKAGIRIITIDKLNTKQKEYVYNYFKKMIFPVLTPLAVDKSRPFPLLASRTLNIAVRLIKDDKSNFAVVQVPSILPRFLKVPDTEDNVFVLIEDIIMSKLDELFELYKIKASCPFRITRDADIEINECAGDLLIEIQKSIKRQKRGKPVRLEIAKNCCDKHTRKFLIKMLEMNSDEIYDIDGPIDLRFLSKFSELKGYDNLRYPSIREVNPPADLCGYSNIFDAIKEKDIMVFHPFESFDSVINFVRTAAEDENVLAIKQTLYRVSGNSPIISELIKAAENGKQVTVLVELKARFDEERNIIWAKKLEKAGCHVIYGLSGLKTHCKILLVVRKEKDKIKRYIHLGTGNYNDSTAKLYTDIGMFTCKEEFGMDASSLFNTLTGYSRVPEYNKIIVAPLYMRKFFEKMIKAEIRNAKKGLKSGIVMKVNSVVDYNIIKLLYEASKAGVDIKLIVRGICCLIPGIEKVSENIKVISIIGRFLEHSRIYKFENAGNPKIYMGSADLMPRNLDKRVELIFPIEDDRLKKRAFNILDLYLKDNVNARLQLPDTSYVNINKGRKVIDSQLEFSKLAQRAQSEVIDIIRSESV